MGATQDERIRVLDAVEARAYRDMLSAAPPALAAALGLEAREIGGATLLLAPGLPPPIFNRVIGLGDERPPTPAELDAVVGAYRAAGVARWWIHVSPTTYQAPLLADLASRGFVPAEPRAWAKLERGRAPEAPRVAAGVEVEEVAGAGAPGLGEAICAAFDVPAALAPWFAALAGWPGWRAVADRVDGRIVGGAFAHLQGEDAWLGVGGVRPEARRRHAHRALMAARVRLATEAGCVRIATETGEPAGGEENPSLRNMIACGFAPAFSRLNLAAPA